MTVCQELNHKSYKSLGDIDDRLQEKIDEYPLRVIKILRDSDPLVRFDIFERLNRGSVKLNDQELLMSLLKEKQSQAKKKTATHLSGGAYL